MAKLWRDIHIERRLEKIEAWIKRHDATLGAQQIDEAGAIGGPAGGGMSSNGRTAALQGVITPGAEDGSSNLPVSPASSSLEEEPRPETRSGRRGDNWTQPANKSLPCFLSQESREEWCALCSNHIRNHYGGTEYRCPPLPAPAGENPAGSSSSSRRSAALAFYRSLPDPGTGALASNKPYVPRGWPDEPQQEPVKCGTCGVYGVVQMPGTGGSDTLPRPMSCPDCRGEE